MTTRPFSDLSGPILADPVRAAHVASERAEAVALHEAGQRSAQAAAALDRALLHVGLDRYLVADGEDGIRVTLSTSDAEMLAGALGEVLGP